MEKIPLEKLEAVPRLFSLTDKVAVVTGGSRGLGRGKGQRGQGQRLGGGPNQ